MKGRNTIIFCASQMNEAMEKYLTEHFIKDRPLKVLSVKKGPDAFQFEIEVEGIVTPVSDD